MRGKSVAIGRTSATTGNAINVTADNVIIDLGGHELSAPSAGSDVVAARGVKHDILGDLIIRNCVIASASTSSSIGIGYYTSGGVSKKMTVLSLTTPPPIARPPSPAAPPWA
jgi:hypothetical protein